MRFQGKLIAVCSFVFAIGLGLTNEARAQTFCLIAAAGVHDGGEYSTTIKTVVSGFKRPASRSAWCVQSWQSLGAMYRPFEIVQRPRLGRAEVRSNYMVGYQSAKAGTDQFKIKVYWVQAANGKQASAIMTYNVTVVDQPY